MNKTKYCIKIYTPYYNITENICDPYVFLSHDIDQTKFGEEYGFWTHLQNAEETFEEVSKKMKNTIYTKLYLIEIIYINLNNNTQKILKSKTIKKFERNIGPIFQIQCYFCKEMFKFFLSVNYLKTELKEGWKYFAGKNPDKCCEGIKNSDFCDCYECKWVCSYCSITEW